LTHITNQQKSTVTWYNASEEVHPCQTWWETTQYKSNNNQRTTDCGRTSTTKHFHWM